ncbi:MAG TPA: PHP domain-containing protein [Solirubrobacteraceae bacterium]|nr:PHP domain-containing protein [Solirubrobacteraceae bacterium]
MPEDRPTFDLQSHSLFSDGALPPREVVARAAAAGVELLALSDHDTIDGVDAAMEAAREHGIRVVSAVEISTVDPAGGDLHILGYGLDQRDPGLVARLAEFRADRENRGWAMVAALRELGFDLDEEALRRRTAHGKSLGRPHIAQAVVSHPANAVRLATEGRTDPVVFLKAYLIEGRPAFRLRERPTVAGAIECIHAAGGSAVWAHPFWDVSSPTAVLDTIDRFRDLGLDGVECFYATHTRVQTNLLADRCHELGLLCTGSSDFHGPDHRAFSRFRGFATFGREPVLGPILEAAQPARPAPANGGASAYSVTTQIRS